MSIKANIQIPSKGDNSLVSQNKQNIKVEKGSKNNITVSKEDSKSTTVSVPSPSDNKTVTKVKQSVSVENKQKNNISVVERTTYATSSIPADGSDKTKTMSINTQAWVLDVDEYTINFTHNLNKYPSISVVDSFNRVLELNVEYIDKNTVELTTKATFSGKVHFN